MAVGVFSWSVSAGSNGNADANVNWSEGQLAPTVNNSARAMMAAIRAWTLALGGAITYGGSSNAYTATNNTVGVWSVLTDGNIIALRANHTNSGAATLAVDGLTAKAIRTSDNGALAVGDIVSGGIYLLAYHAGNDNFQILNTIAGGSYQPLDATLTALAGLTTGADLGIYFTGTDLVTTFSLTAAGRALLDDADASAQRTTLGLGTMATQAASSYAALAGAAFTGGGVTVTINSTNNTIPLALYYASNAFGYFGSVGTNELGLYDGALTSHFKIAAAAHQVVGGSASPDLRMLDAPTTQAATSVGFRGIPPSFQNGDYTLLLSDNGKSIVHNPGSGTHAHTVPPSGSVAWPLNAAISFYNLSGSQVITAGSGVTLYQFDGSGTLNTGNVTVPIAGVAVITYIGSNNWLVSGHGT